MTSPHHDIPDKGDLDFTPAVEDEAPTLA